MNQDEQYLQILSIFHFVVAGLVALVACFPICHFTMGLAMLFASLFAGSQETAAEPVFPAFIGLFFTLIAGSLILLGWTLAACIALTGWNLNKRRRYTFCLVVACIECIFMPLGTVLGIFTILMLLKPPVKAMFGLPVLEEL